MFTILRVVTLHIFTREANIQKRGLILYNTPFAVTNVDKYGTTLLDGLRLDTVHRHRLQKLAVLRRLTLRLETHEVLLIFLQ